MLPVFEETELVEQGVYLVEPVLHTAAQGGGVDLGDGGYFTNNDRDGEITDEYNHREHHNQGDCGTKGDGERLAFDADAPEQLHQRFAEERQCQGDEHIDDDVEEKPVITGRQTSLI